ncbi:chromate efflux transporter [Pseudoroseomonas globiformis]|uniref:Chromate efflux transporter n=1 Tax=Teichococcus globiformis TaxID=2307229 RepID=A0ABV7FUG9_9PROT
MAPGRHAAAEVFLAFLRLGLTSFGGPAAHLGYFRTEFVFRRRWLSEEDYAGLVALCQFLPGPASSQLGFALGLRRGGWWGGLAAWAGFTLPSAMLLVLFAAWAVPLSGSVPGAGLLHGLKLVAVAIVVQAVWGMAGGLCPDRPRAAIAFAALALALLAPAEIGQVSAMLLGAGAGLLWCRGALPDRSADRSSEDGGLHWVPLGRRGGAVCLLLFAALLVLPPLLGPELAVFDAFYRAGALVFGGGHVVLPLLQDAVTTPGWVTEDAFLAGYGAAQAVPGPLFTFAAYLGAVIPPGGVAGAVLPLLAVFLPGMLILLGTLPFWVVLRRHPRAAAAVMGVNAAVVGVLGAALYDPVFVSAVRQPQDLVLAVGLTLALLRWRMSSLTVVGLGATAGLVVALATQA